MKRIGTAIPLVAVAMLVAACGAVDDRSLEGVAAGVTGGAAPQDGRSLPDWHPPLPQGHPSLGDGQTILPPGHPVLPEGMGECPAGGLARDRERDRFREAGADSPEIISI